MTTKRRQPFSIPTEQIAAILLADGFELLETRERVKRLDRMKVWNPEWLADAELKLKWGAIQAWYTDNKENGEGPRYISVERELANGKKIRGYLKTERATLKDLISAETGYYKLANTCFKRSMELRGIALEKYGEQIGLPYEFETRTVEFYRARRVKKAGRKTRRERRTEVEAGR